MTSTANATVTWDYTEHATHYDKRADYAGEAIDALIAATGCVPGKPVAEIGAGTGKLTKELLQRGFVLRSVEPNDAMREIGIRNTHGQAVTWSVGTGEASGLPGHTFQAAFFGSSFNVVDQAKTLAEVARILLPTGWFACMWNHRDLDDPVQERIESIIKAIVPGYSYGSRRENPTAVIGASGLFTPVRAIERTYRHAMSQEDIMIAWKSHATLRRQSGSEAVFHQIIDAISAHLKSLPAQIEVPYTTRIYYAQRCQ
jgi:ubiquinone/menaquinone biosynthesis C-methylase UbiE